ncbi:single-stranded-DNA-specific exonuclease RecJ [Sulfobacillus thermosulfidooxidans]|uniref:single-stranded-DNA-specific exonuclease RecJ n=1 Tax=Sulfobacillus thermosulfidooxidans TaxID=28034 RepID=UPI00096B6B9C|nr:single-stranded-DNA-specific exonuclease RecJ [Sulfobacillus thermosulfidooxidans]OLZ08602.1 single-stranded-DNA-specific exonuclease RecJ [Sulfobacillus thermosulfidooxidans]OLZ13205.1 single-stranded-DNA-specific exonuclease RecJ [Sulfobacillus thermosulfidooxidans]OLZ21585.1 single-stranded-DNA-specific exonuclease RecJ [Sulfobacillus thermosulfidooxidans]
MNVTHYLNRPYRQAWTHDEDQESFRLFQQQVGLSEITAKILWLRNIRSLEDYRRLMLESRELSDPEQLPDLTKAVTFLENIRRDHKSIRVYGDYDADGVSATALMYQGLVWAGFPSVDYYIPNRFDEGYGLSCDAVVQAAADGIDVLITVDCGSSSQEAADLAAQYGIDLIITDHHGLPPVLPRARALVNPERMNEPNRFSGVGVALQLLRALLHDDVPPWAYAVAAIGTVADIVPLTGDNRLIVQRGLQALDMGACPGVSALLGERIKTGQRIHVDDLGFFVGPHLNAAGRMGDATPAVGLLLAARKEDAEPLAALLREKNQVRRDIEQEVLRSALAQMASYDQRGLPPFVVLAGDKWHHGVIGIVASRIKDLVKRPVAIIGWEQDEGKGSARSVPGLHLLNHLAKHRDVFLKLGGHRGACGFSLVRQDPYELSLRFSGSLPEEILTQQFVDKTVDLRIKAENLTPQVMDEFKALEPFGHGFERPQFAVVGTLESLRLMGQDKQHVAMTLEDTTVRVVGFNQGDVASSFLVGMPIEFIGELVPNFFQGREEYQWRSHKLVNARALDLKWRSYTQWEVAPSTVSGRIIYVVNSTREQHRVAKDLGAVSWNHHWDYGTRLVQEEKLRARSTISVVVNQWGLWPEIRHWAHHIIWLSPPASQQCLAMAASLLDVEGMMWVDPRLSPDPVVLKGKRLVPHRQTLARLWRARQQGFKPLIIGGRVFEELGLEAGVSGQTRRDLHDSPSYQRAHTKWQEILASWQKPVIEWAED